MHQLFSLDNNDQYTVYASGFWILSLSPPACVCNNENTQVLTPKIYI